MLTFLRKIRKSIIESGSFSRYLVYALGEIALVVIGILIALQINNWNERKKDLNKEKEYLSGIANDLRADTAIIHIISDWLERKSDEHMFVDSIYDNGLFQTLSDRQIRMSMLLAFGQSFYPKTASYGSLISSGMSNLIRNEELFGRIQNLYDVRYPRIVAMHHRGDELSNEISFKHIDKLRFGTSLEAIQDRQFIADLWFLKRRAERYGRQFEQCELEVVSLIRGIEDELAN